MFINYIRNYLSAEQLKSIRDSIAKIENFTSGEIRLCLKLKRSFKEKKMSPRENAVSEFYNLGMDKTKDGTGVLIYILFKERLFEIIADNNIYSRINESVFDSVTARMADEFKKNNYLEGILHCINEIGAIMKKEFPRKPDDVNELPDEIVIK